MGSEMPQSELEVYGTSVVRKFSQPFVLALMAFLAISALTIAVVWSERKDSYALTKVSVLNTAKVLATQVESSLEEIDALLNVVALRVKRAAPLHADELATLQAQIQDELPFYKLVARVGVADNTGRVVLNSGWRAGEKLVTSLKDREYFKRAQAGENILFIEGPVRAKLDNQWSLALARRLEDEQGNFNGIVFAVVPVTALGDVFGKINLGSSGVINLRTKELVQIVRYPALEGVEQEPGNRTVSHVLQQLVKNNPDAESHVYTAIAPIDGVERIYAYQQFEHSPLAISVGLALSDVNYSWLQTAYLMICLLCLTGGMLFWSALKLNRYQRGLLDLVGKRTASLAESEKRYRELFKFNKEIVDSMPDGLLVVNAQGIVLRCNEGVLNLFGYTLDTVLGSGIEILIPERFRAAYREQFSQFVSNDESFDSLKKSDWLAVNHDGEEFFIDLRFNKVLSASQMQIICTVRDISKEKKQADVLELQRQRLQLIIEGTLAGTWEWNIQTGTILFNERWAEILGYTLKELEPISIETWARLTHPDDFVKAGELLEAHFVGRLDFYDCELRMRHKNGHWIYILARGRVNRWSNDGQPLLMSGTHLDITERKRLEAELKLSERFMRLLIDIIPGMVGYWDADLRCGFANMAYREWFGKTPEQMSGISMQDLLGLELFHKNEKFIHAALAGQRQRFERTLVKADGSTGYTWAHYVPDIVEGQVRGFFVLVSDVTELKQIQVQLEETNMELEQRSLEAEAASRAKSAFVATMSHEIRTPMNAVIGLLELIQHTGLDAHQRDYVRKAEQAAKSLLGILNDILDFSKVEAGKLLLDDACFRLDDIWKNLSVVLSAALRNKSVEILFDIDTQIPHALRGDGMRLQQVLLNLAGNAVKFTEQGEVIIRARLLEAKIGSIRIEFFIQDTGIGIPADRLLAVFEGFTQAENSTARRYGGTGLGLAISQRLVRLMGGELIAESTLGIGSCFHFAIEFGFDAEVCALDERINNELNTTKLMQSTPSILIGDHHPLTRELLLHMAQHFGWYAEVAADELTVIAKVNNAITAGHPFSVICLDGNMQTLDGWNTARHIRSIEPVGLHIPIVLMATTQRCQLLEGRLAENPTVLDGFLVKPVTPSTLFEAVLAALDEKRITISSTPTPVTEHPLAGLRLLVVEDNLLNQQVAQELLAYAGAEVWVVSNGVAAIQTVQSDGQLFDAVLMDIQMPEMDGYEATCRLRAIGFSAPIIAMTANALPSDRETCLAAGMNDHIGKPIDSHELVNTLLKQCGRHISINKAVVALPPTVAALSVAGFDVHAALNRLNGNQAVYAQLARNFISNQGTVVQRIKQALSQQDHALVMRELHTLKGVAATVGASPLAALARILEEEVRQKGAVLTEEQFKKMSILLADTIDTLQKLADSFTQEAQISSANSMDSAHVIELLETLALLLSEQNMRALDVFSVLKREAGVELGRLFVALENTIQRLDFAAALEVVNAIRKGFE